jgi:hypothetical protein
MAMLSPEMNRFLGCALLDSRMLQNIFSGDRFTTMQRFDLQPEERSRILASKAKTLPELSRELTAEFAVADVADAEAEIDHFYQSLHPSTTMSLANIHSIVQRAINTLPDAQVAVNADRLNLKTAS